MIGIYKITNPKGKVYVGQSININKRFKDYLILRNCKKQTKLYRSLNKYGVDNHKFEIVEECDLHLLNERERYYQDLYNCLNNGLNCVLTKNNNLSGKLSEETKKKISESNKGREVSEITRNKIGNSQKGEKHHNFGKKLSKEHKNKISKSNTGKIKSLKERNEISERMKGNLRSFNKSKNKERFILNTETGIFYNSVAEVSRLLNIPLKTLYNYLTGHRLNKTSFIFV